MKTTKLAILIVTIAMALFILIPNLSWADDGASLYKTKCAACHGADGAGKPAAKIPSLTSDEAKKMSDDDISKAVNVIDPSTGKPYDVRAAVAKRIDDACNDAHLVGYACIARYKPGNDPYVDKYNPLHTRPDAASLGPGDRIITERADDQPFPMYGRVRVAWS